MKKQTIFLLVICILSFAGHLFVYPMLPEEVPIHWNVYGEADNWAGKASTLFLALLPMLMLLMLRIIPKIDPRGKSYEKHQKAYQIFITLLILFLNITLWITNALCLGYPVPIERLIPIGVGIILLTVGNHMPQLRTNYTMGIKEQLIFPEIEYDKVDKIRGMDIVFVTTAKTDEEARELLRLFGMPFAK